MSVANTTLRCFRAGLTAAAAAVLLGCTLAPSSVQAQVPVGGFVLTLQQVGPNVVATGSGLLDVTGLTLSSSNIGPAIGQIEADIALVAVGSGKYDLYTGISGPANFGTGLFLAANSSTGSFVGVQGGGSGVFSKGLFVPPGFTSGAVGPSTATWDNATFASLGVTPGTYEWTWGIGANQNFTLQIGTVVPEPATWSLLAVGVFLCVFLRRRAA
ncbi:MAG: PEP-CTERM sorting domain-containing protein [Verrucomicrobia bacterium]|nr:PEP-CTERM sorting domain-containing protein [Verrucomicrobiota bacterium]